MPNLHLILLTLLLSITSSQGQPRHTSLQLGTTLLTLTNGVSAITVSGGYGPIRPDHTPTPNARFTARLDFFIGSPTWPYQPGDEQWMIVVRSFPEHKRGLVIKRSITTTNIITIPYPPYTYYDSTSQTWEFSSITHLGAELSARGEHLISYSADFLDPTTLTTGKIRFNTPFAEADHAEQRILNY